jgi:hypothetical protein
MSSIFSILSSGYVSAGLNISATSNTPYVNVDPASYEGSWTGKYADNSSYTFTISNVNGFRAKVKYQSGSTLQYQDVLIKDGAFRIGNSKFTLARSGVAQVKTVVTSPVDGSNILNTSYAQQQT